MESQLQAAGAEIRRLKLRVMDDILIIRDGHFIGSRPHAGGYSYVNVMTPDGVKALPLQIFCVNENDLLHHAFVVFDNDHQVAATWSDVPPPFMAWCAGGQTLPMLPEAAS